MMESMAEVSGPFHSSQGRFRLLWGRWYKTLEDMRCVVSRLDMYRTNVRMYLTMVLLACLTKVRR